MQSFLFNIILFVWEEYVKAFVLYLLFISTFKVELEKIKNWIKLNEFKLYKKLK